MLAHISRHKNAILSSGAAMPTTILTDGLFSYPAGLYVLSVERGVIQSVERIGDVGDTPANLPRPTIDLRGKAVLPGLVDSHVHLVGTAMQFVTPSVRGIDTPDKLITAIAPLNLS